MTGRTSQNPNYPNRSLNSDRFCLMQQAAIDLYQKRDIGFVVKKHNYSSVKAFSRAYEQFFDISPEEALSRINPRRPNGNSRWYQGSRGLSRDYIKTGKFHRLLKPRFKWGPTG